MSNLIVIVDRKHFRVDVIDPGPNEDNPLRIHSCRCAVGMEGYRTPADEYKTGPRSRKPDWLAPSWAEMPLTPGRVYKYGSQFNPYAGGLISLKAIDEKGEPRTGYALHGTKNEASIPGAASHGCIRLLDADIKWMYDNLKENTLVIIR
jgi:lipoprotein-anchoring transpeptidase ErfK/SrfK